MIAETLNQIKEMAKRQAKYLRQRSPEMTGTQIIAEEDYVPDWSGEKDYSGVVIGAPVKDEGQVYALLQPHNAGHYPHRPAQLPALWRVKHTTDPAKAKPWVQPTSTSDMYLKDECMVWTDGEVYRAQRDTSYSPEEYAADWELANVESV